jgi:pimeloyl-ACP methyl ester carboxylesterase
LTVPDIFTTVVINSLKLLLTHFSGAAGAVVKVMERAVVDGLELAFELRGSGEPVVLIHWGVSATWAEPLLDEPALRDRYRILSYHRGGFGGSSPIEGPVTMADHARHCLLLMRRLGIERAHVVGHSSSVAVALQLALDAAEAVQTVVSMDAARPAPPTELQAAFRHEFVEPAVERYRAGDTEGAVDTFFRGVFGPDYRSPLERGLPGAFDQAVVDADAFFTQELPALWQHWSFTEEDARRITRPVLVVVGEKSAPTFPERAALLLSWLPNAEPFELPGATHLLHAQNPRGMAEGLASFFARHPIPTPP